MQHPAADFGGGGEGHEMDFDENDPELLAELEALSGGGSAASAKQPSCADPSRSIASKARCDDMIGIDDADATSDADNDHELLSELNSLNDDGQPAAKRGAHSGIRQQNSINANVEQLASANAPVGDDADLLDLKGCVSDSDSIHIRAYQVAHSSMPAYGQASDYGDDASSSSSIISGSSRQVPVRSQAGMSQLPAQGALTNSAAARPSKPSAPQLSPASLAAIERYKGLAEAVRKKALAAKNSSSAPSQSAVAMGRKPSSSSAAASDTDNTASTTVNQTAAHWLAEYKGLQAELQLLTSGVPPEQVEAVTSARRAKAARDKGYAELRAALYGYYKGRIEEGRRLAASLRTPGLHREEKAALKRGYEGVLTEKKQLEAVSTTIILIIKWLV